MRNRLNPSDRGFYEKETKQVVLVDIPVVGWAHDTLTSINANANCLFQIIHDKVGQEGPPIVLLCHSRGGLLARKLAVIMQKQGGNWTDKIKLCVTFGTPHRGAELAAHPLRFMGAYAGVTSSLDKRTLSVFRLLSYYSQQERFEGIDDLRPAEARGEFLRKLEEEERELAKPDGLRKLPIRAVGGTYRGSHLHWMKMMMHLLGTVDHDLVVRKKSTVPDGFFDAGVPKCSHFEYFSPSEIKQDYFQKMFNSVKEALRFDEAVQNRVAKPATKAKAATIGDVRGDVIEGVVT